MQPIKNKFHYYTCDYCGRHIGRGKTHYIDDEPVAGQLMLSRYCKFCKEML